MNLLQIVQRVLSALNSDEVSTISDTVESEQVVLLVNTVYTRLMNEYPWPHLYTYGNLEVTDISHQMKIPNNIVQLDWIRYNRKDVTYIEPEEMIRKLDSRILNNSEDIDEYGAVTNKDPQYWTSLDDTYIIFDSYDGSLVSTNTYCKFVKQPVVMTDDTDIPDLPERFHYVILDASLAEAFRTLNQDEVTARTYDAFVKRGKVAMQRWARKVNQTPSLYHNDFGRRSSGPRKSTRG